MDSILKENRQQFIEKKIIKKDPKNESRSVLLDWPLKQASTYNYYSYYAVSNFVDHNPNFPNLLQDYNCGVRTYDTQNGYNHQGQDIFTWPFDINMMDNNHVEVIAAAPGIILYKEDGNFDKNCAMNNLNWNVVCIIHSDNTVVWYGHLKMNSLTSKIAGDAVIAGEYLGLIGSSGSSTGPHLHFEIQDNDNNVIDPYYGDCNNTAPSMWNVQKPYYESTVNVLMTHSAPPVINSCPNPHSMNAENNYQPGDPIYFAAYYHDQRANQNLHIKFTGQITPFLVHGITA
ncbi:MAG: M23 family metallopeptidase [Bacteroidetes bacterium]|nr:M23 family metallopeptidase [Bacteroidota bacterium]HET6245883.1 M23 family metallopeptidase [Bacteroidia bacterium]